MATEAADIDHRNRKRMLSATALFLSFPFFPFSLRLYREIFEICFSRFCFISYKNVFLIVYSLGSRSCSISRMRFRASQIKVMNLCSILTKEAFYYSGEVICACHKTRKGLLCSDRIPELPNLSVKKNITFDWELNVTFLFLGYFRVRETGEIMADASWV